MSSPIRFGPQLTTPKAEPEPIPEVVETPVQVEAPHLPQAAPQEVVEFQSMAAKLPNAGVTPEQRDALDRWTRRSRPGVFTQAPMLCRNEECPFLPQCPLKYPPAGPDGKAVPEIPRPEGEPCPVESHITEVWIADFLSAFAVNSTDPDFPLIKIILSDLILETMLQTRLSWHLSMDPSPIVMDFIGMNARGEPIYVQKISPALEQLNKSGQAKLKFLKEMLATPRAKIDAKRKGWQDPASRAADALARGAKLRRLREGQSKVTRVDIVNPHTQTLGDPSKVKEAPKDDFIEE